jgi:hypothetical protein
VHSFLGAPRQETGLPPSSLLLPLTPPPLPPSLKLRLCLACQHEMRECKSLFNEYQSLAPMYTFEFWLETLSKSIKSSAPSATPYRGDSLQEDHESSDSKVPPPLRWIL